MTVLKARPTKCLLSAQSQRSAVLWDVPGACALGQPVSLDRQAGAEATAPGDYALSRPRPPSWELPLTCFGERGAHPGRAQGRCWEHPPCRRGPTITCSPAGSGARTAAAAAH